MSLSRSPHSDPGVASRSPPPIPVSCQRHRVLSFRSLVGIVARRTAGIFTQRQRDKEDGEFHFAAFAFAFGRACLASLLGLTRFGAASSRAQLAGSGSSAVAAASTASMS